MYLEFAKNSGVSGTATFLETTGGVEVKLDIGSLPKPDTINLAHLHSGRCGEEAYEHGEEQGDTHTNEHDERQGGEIEYPLSPVKSDSEGRVSSTTTLWDTALAKLFSGEPIYVTALTTAINAEPLPFDERLIRGERPGSRTAGKYRAQPRARTALPRETLVRREVSNASWKLVLRSARGPRGFISASAQRP